MWNWAARPIGSLEDMLVFLNSNSKQNSKARILADAVLMILITWKAKNEVVLQKGEA